MNVTGSFIAVRLPSSCEYCVPLSAIRFGVRLPINRYSSQLIRLAKNRLMLQVFTPKVYFVAA